MRFLATLPDDAELAQRTEAFAAADARLRDLYVKRDAYQAELDTLDGGALFDASAKEQAAIIQRRMLLVGLLAAMPAQLSAAMRARTLANLAWLQRVRQLARAQLQQAQGEVDGFMERRGALHKELNRIEERWLSPAEASEQTAAVMAQMQANATAALPAQSARGQAQMVVEVCEILSRQYGEQVRLDRRHTWDEAASRAGRPSTASIGRSLVQV
jgi:hypothetical protein